MNISPELWLSFAERLGWALLHSLWQGAAVAGALGLLLVALRRRSAALRHVACLLALISIAVSAAWTVWIAFPKDGAPPRSVAAPRAVTTPPPPQAALPAAPLISAEVVLPPSHPASAPSRTVAPGRTSWRERLAQMLPWMSAAWLAGVALLTFRHLTGWRRVRAVRRAGAAARPELQRTLERLLNRFGRKTRVCLLESAEAAVPMLAGLLKPAVLLPLRVISGLSEREIEAILAHELAHLVRYDAWSNLAQVAIETLFFYHPAIWWIARRARQEREYAADDLALQICADRRVYAGALAQVAELRLASPFALAATGGSLLARIQRIVGPGHAETPASGWSVCLPVLLTALALVTLFGARAQEEKVIRVAPGESIQAAIDAAPPGAVIRLGEGEWKERLVISKPLTLEGAGWEKTRIQPDQLPPGVTPESKAQFRHRYVQGLSENETAALEGEWAEKFARPTLLVRDTRDVTVQGVRVGGVAPPRGQGAGGEALVVFRTAQAAMRDCAIIGPAEDGIQISDGSNVEISRSLVAALRGQGIAVEGWNPPNAPSRLHLIESEVRNVFVAGVHIGRNCDGTLIERCRIYAVRGGGIQYEEASPTIVGSTIFKNGRSGIHAHGKTRATVRGNLFWGNQLAGMSCWFENADVIEANTFVENYREALLVMGNSKPVLRRNVFAHSRVALRCGMVGTQIGAPIVDGNLFWGVSTALDAMHEKRPAPEGSLTVDPQFRDTGKGDFVLAPSSPARAANIGNLEPLAPASPWRVLPEEAALVRATNRISDTQAPIEFVDVKASVSEMGPATLNLSLVPQVAEFEGFINYGSPIQITSTNALGQQVVSVITPDFIKQPIFSTGEIKPSVGIFAGQNVVVGESLLADGRKMDAVPPTASKQRLPSEELTNKAADDSKSWVADAFQLDDAKKRETAIERVRAAMTSGDSDEARKGVAAFVQLGAIEFDKASFRPAVRTLLRSADAPTRAAAASAFTMTGTEPEDLERILALTDDPAAEVREPLTHIIVQLTKHDLTGKPASDAILKLMNNLPRDSRSVAHAMWGCKLSPEIEARVLEFSRGLDHASNSDVGYNFFYGALSTQANKSEASCRRLIELLAHQDTTNIAGRAAWGLRQGVAKEQYPLVADAMLRVLEARSDGYLGREALTNLRTYGDARHAPAVKALLAKPGVTGDFRKLLEETLASVETRPVEEAGSAEISSPDRTVIDVAEDGSVKSEGKPLTLDELKATLQTNAAANADHALLIRAAKRAKYKVITGILDVCREAEIWNVAYKVSDQDLPKNVASNDAEQAVQNRAVLNVAGDGSINWGGKTISLDELKEKLSAVAKLHPDFAVVVQSSEQTAYKVVADLLALCREAKISNVSFQTPTQDAAATAEARPTAPQRSEQLVARNRQAARLRAAEDRRNYTPEQLQEIETLYQVANTKGKRSPEAIASLKQLLEKYDKANRTGCATLYLGQASEGAERLEYLTRAVEKFSDCYYFNGCQVGGYGRYVLALTLWERGEKEKARTLFGELKTTYKDATDHGGRPMGEVAEAAEKELFARKAK